jgi:hypothetical protein
MVIAGNKEIKESIIHGEETTSEVNKMISSLTDSLKGAFDVKNSQ